MLGLLLQLAAAVLTGTVSLIIPTLLIAATVFDATDMLIHLSFVYVLSRMTHHFLKEILGVRID